MILRYNLNYNVELISAVMRFIIIDYNLFAL